MVTITLFVLALIFGLAGVYYGKMSEKIHCEVNPFMTQEDRLKISQRFDNFSITGYSISIILIFILIILELT